MTLLCDKRDLEWKATFTTGADIKLFHLKNWNLFDIYISKGLFFSLFICSLKRSKPMNVGYKKETNIRDSKLRIYNKKRRKVNIQPSLYLHNSFLIKSKIIFSQAGDPGTQ